MTNKVCNLSVLGSKQNHFLDIGFIFLISIGLLEEIISLASVW